MSGYDITLVQVVSNWASKVLRKLPWFRFYDTKLKAALYITVRTLEPWTLDIFVYIFWRLWNEGSSSYNVYVRISYNFYRFDWEVSRMGLQVPFAPYLLVVFFKNYIELFIVSNYFFYIET